MGYLKNTTKVIVSKVMEEIQALIEKEIERRVQEKLTTFIELVSRTYDISMKVLLRDLGKKGSNSTDSVGCGDMCMGVTAKGKRCTFGATHQGYCKKHLYQKKPERPRPPMRVQSADPVGGLVPSEPGSGPKHNHTIPPLFCATCPACKHDRENKPTQKLLIDM